SLHCPYCVQFYFNDPPTTATYTLSLHDALPICRLIAPLRVQCSVPRPDPLADPDVPKGMSIELLKDLHLLTRDGQLNADARRKLKQIRHLVGLLKPALDDSLARSPDPIVVDCGAGKSYLGALLYELVLGPAGKG